MSPDSTVSALYFPALVDCMINSMQLHSSLHSNSVIVNMWQFTRYVTFTLCFVIVFVDGLNTVREGASSNGEDLLGEILPRTLLNEVQTSEEEVRRSKR